MNNKPATDCESRPVVLVVIRWPVGGIRTFMRYVYRDFGSDQFKIVVLMPKVEEYETLMDDLAPSGVEFELIASDRFPALLRALYGAVRLYRPVVLHAQGMTSALACSPFRLLGRFPLVTTLHDVSFERKGSGLKGVLQASLVKLALTASNRIHCVSDAAQKKLLQSFPFLQRKTGKVIMIPNRIETRRFLDAKPLDLRTEFSIPESTPIIGFFGRFMGPKGFRVLVEALALLARNKDQELDLQLMAFGGGGYIREDQAYVASQGLDNIIRFMPFASDIGPAIKAVDLVVIPSLWETGPILPMEVLVSGVPIIGTDCIGLGQLLGNTPATVVPAGDAAALAAAIRERLNNNLGTEEARLFVAEAAEKYDATKTSAAIRSMYIELST